ncbi:MAG: transcriptional regulator [Hydrogenophilales bacterium CG17_big_fil_post_rev_8_21_14_2_50_63_12]|nr:MAG: transcriptional regulator [Hydrogenophilales bacterium CG17_big_fil_post_rev_8_21_14_2_50_63_12]
MAASLLIVDDDKLTRETLASALGDAYRVQTASGGRAALDILAADRIDVVLSDMTMPGMDGLGLLEAINLLEDRPAVIFITGQATVESAVRAMKLGAHDYVTKPVNLDRLELLLEKALESRTLRQENAQLKHRLREKQADIQLVGQSPAMRKIVDLAIQVASTDASVLIEGESGTGKELIASLIHHHSPRASAPFIKVNCAAFAEGVLESELFGHEKGAFTGATATRKGRFEMADGGTLFLDEIGDLPTSAQVKLLRFLQERTFERVGGGKTFKVDVRIISATNKILKEQVAAGEFREDLYYRLRVVALVLPPLRERPEDIDPLIDHFLRHFSKLHHRPIKGMDEEVRHLLNSHGWPGNVRELINCIESMVVMARDNHITLDDVPDHLVAAYDIPAGGAAGEGVLADMERQAIVDALHKTDGNKMETARILGIGLRTLYRKIDKWGL